MESDSQLPALRRQREGTELPGQERASFEFTHAPFPRGDPGSPLAFLNGTWEELWAEHGAQTREQTALV